MEDIYCGKPMSYWYAIMRRIDMGEDAYSVHSLLTENALLHSKVGMYETRIKTLIEAFDNFQPKQNGE